MTNCPICNKLYSRINLSEQVCEKHQNWLVTVCAGCKQPVFSDCRNICPECAPAPDDDYANIEHDAMFRELGLKRG